MGTQTSEQDMNATSKTFLTHSSLEFIPRETLSPVLGKINGHHHATILVDRYPKLTRAVSTSKASVTHIATSFYNNCIVPYGILPDLMTDNDIQFLTKLFETVCNFLGLNYITNTAYHAQTNEQETQCNRMLVARLCHYIAEHQRDWNIFGSRSLTRTTHMSIA